jgi:hypothetical protein
VKLACLLRFPAMSGRFLLGDSMYTSKEIERFWSKIDKERSQIFYNGTRCWEWTGAPTHNGYGRFPLRSGTIRAHRVAYELDYGDIPDGLFVLHHCDNRLCCHPLHLFLGTQQNNMDDMAEKGRSTAGEKHANHKLTDSQVAEIRRSYGFWGKGGETSTALAKEFGVNQTQISSIVGGKTWKHLDGEIHESRRLTDEQVSEIRRRYSFWGIAGEDSVTLAKEFGVSSKTIRNIANYKFRK